VGIKRSKKKRKRSLPCKEITINVENPWDFGGVAVFFFSGLGKSPGEKMRPEGNAVLYSYSSEKEDGGA
jgi:hypothetical protein